jgi:hypothetical protein
MSGNSIQAGWAFPKWLRCCGSLAIGPSINVKLARTCVSREYRPGLLEFGQLPMVCTAVVKATVAHCRLIWLALPVFSKVEINATTAAYRFVATQYAIINR